MKAKTINVELSEIIKLLMEAHTYGSKTILYAQIRKLAQLNREELWLVQCCSVLTEVQSVDDYMRVKGYNQTEASKALGVSRGNLSTCVGDTHCKYHAIIGGVFMKGKYNPEKGQSNELSS